MIVIKSALVVQWLGFLSCDQKVMGLNPGIIIHQTHLKEYFSEQENI